MKTLRLTDIDFTLAKCRVCELDADCATINDLALCKRCSAKIFDAFTSLFSRNFKETMERIKVAQAAGERLRAYR